MRTVLASPAVRLLSLVLAVLWLAAASGLLESSCCDDEEDAPVACATCPGCPSTRLTVDDESPRRDDTAPHEAPLLADDTPVLAAPPAEIFHVPKLLLV